ncbi:hypothetical protein GCM10010400_43070 [Streptomyces aculeolatus]
MGLRTALSRIATRRPAVLLAVHPGGTQARLAVEAGLRRRGWPVAASPAAASGLLVVGAGGPADGAWVDALWGQIPYPKARSAVAGPSGVETALDALVRPVAAPAGGGHDEGGGHEGHRGHEGHEGQEGHGGRQGHGSHHGQDSQDSAGHQHHGGHGGHGASHSHIGPVAGLPMAERADDRDGLRLDRLHLPLGPGLTDWPAGLVLDVALQGDVVQRAAVRTVPPPDGGLPYWDEPWLRAARGEDVRRGTAARRCCAAHLDSVGRLLAVSGWPDPAARAPRLRDAVLGGAPVRAWGAELGRLARRVRGSRYCPDSSAS